MNRAQIVQALWDSGHYKTREGAARAVADVLAAIQGGVAVHGKVALPGFGTFQAKDRAARTGRNPRTGAPVSIAAKRVVRFRPGSAFKAAVE